jgi:hypothetical protein
MHHDIRDSGPVESADPEGEPGNLGGTDDDSLERQAAAPERNDVIRHLPVSIWPLSDGDPDICVAQMDGAPAAERIDIDVLIHRQSSAGIAHRRRR